MLAGSHARLEHGRALADLGEAVLAAGDASAAKTHLRGALELAHVCGAAALEERVLATLAFSTAAQALRLDAFTLYRFSEHEEETMDEAEWAAPALL